MSVPIFSPETMRNWREMRNFSRTALARYARVSPTTISNYEAGHSKPSPEYWERICTILRWEELSDISDTWQKVQEQVNYTPVTFAFTEGQCYSITRKNKKGFYNASAWNVEELAILRYIGKRGIHHCFRDINGGWCRTYTDAQLIGKTIKEITS